MRIEDLEAFRVLAETLNYTNAANRLYLTQSSLTRTIQQMEEELGFQLFDRSRRSVTLTAAGQSLYEDCAKLLKNYEDIVERARNAQDGSRGIIRFAAHQYFTTGVVHDIIGGFQDENPDILLKLSSNDTEHMIHDLNEGAVDCAVCTGRSANRDIERIVLKHYRECVVLSPRHPLADREEIGFEELRAGRFAVSSRDLACRGYEPIKAKARAAGFDPYVEDLADSAAHLMALVSTGRYITVLSENYQPLACGRLCFVPLRDESTVELAFLWNRGNPNHSVRILAEYVKRNFKKRVGDSL